MDCMEDVNCCFFITYTRYDAAKLPRPGRSMLRGVSRFAAMGDRRVEPKFDLAAAASAAADRVYPAVPRAAVSTPARAAAARATLRGVPHSPASRDIALAPRRPDHAAAAAPVPRT